MVADTSRSTPPPAPLPPVRGFAVVLAPQHDIAALRRVRLADAHAWVLVLRPGGPGGLTDAAAADPEGRWPAYGTDLRRASHVVWVGVPAAVGLEVVGQEGYAALASVHLGMPRKLGAVTDWAEAIRAIRAHRALWQEAWEATRAARARAAETAAELDARQAAGIARLRAAGIVPLYIPRGLR